VAARGGGGRPAGFSARTCPQHSRGAPAARRDRQELRVQQAPARLPFGSVTRRKWLPVMFGDAVMLGQGLVQERASRPSRDPRRCVSRRMLSRNNRFHARSRRGRPRRNRGTGTLAPFVSTSRRTVLGWRVGHRERLRGSASMRSPAAAGLRVGAGFPRGGIQQLVFGDAGPAEEERRRGQLEIARGG